MLQSGFVEERRWSEDDRDSVSSRTFPRRMRARARRQRDADSRTAGLMGGGGDSQDNHNVGETREGGDGNSNASSPRQARYHIVIFIVSFFRVR